MGSIFNLIMLLFLLCHGIACLWMLVQWEHYEKNESSWMTEQVSMIGDDASAMYPFVMYAAMLMLSGDGLDTLTNAESWFCILVTLFGLCALAVLVSNMAVYMANMNAADRIFRETMSSMSDEMANLAIPSTLRTRVLDYYEFMFEHQPHLVESGKSWINRFPKYLQVALRSHLHLHDLTLVPIFKGLSRGFLSQLALHLETQVFMRNEFVFRQGDYGDEMFFVQQGCILVYIEEEGKKAVDDPPAMKIIQALEKGSVLGELAVIFRQPRNAGAIAQNIVMCNSLKKGAFESVIVDFIKDREVLQTNLEQTDLLRGQKLFWDSKYSCFRRHNDVHSIRPTGKPADVNADDSELKSQLQAFEDFRYDMLLFKEQT